MEFFCNFIWEKGLRERNEDSLCIRQVTKNETSYLLAVVCDGIGGLSEGENASSYVVNSMLEALKGLLKENKKLSAGKIRNLFCRRLYQCHRVLQNYGKEHRIRLGTTISMVFLAGKEGHLFHIGDSSVFKGKNCLKRITPLQHTGSGALLQAVGIGKNPKPGYRRFRIGKKMVFLLASDGFCRKCEDELCNKEWIKQVSCDEKEIGELLRRTKERVQKLGEKDNISAICIRVQ